MIGDTCAEDLMTTPRPKPGQRGGGVDMRATRAYIVLLALSPGLLLWVVGLVLCLELLVLLLLLSRLVLIWLLVGS